MTFQELLIVKGIPPAPKDGNSGEQPLATINLLADPENAGWTLNTEDGWNPIIPTFKGGGVWMDSSISEGRTLVAGEDANVVETMQLTVTGNSVTDLAMRLSAMGKMIEDCRNFFIESSIDPVYIHWWAQDAPGPQFAIVYNIEMAIVEPDVWQKPMRDVTLTLEREPYWRGLPPGANPIEWTFQAQRLVRGGANYNSTTMQLYKNTNHLGYAAIKNQHELQTDLLTVITKNYIDIDGDNIPGDAPALVTIDYLRDTTISDVTDLFIARSTKPVTLSSHATVKTHKTLSMLNVGDATAAAGLTKTNDATRGLISNGSNTLAYYGEVTFSANPQTRNVVWGNSSTLMKTLDVNTLRGTYAFFLRHKQNAGALGDITMQLEARIGPGISNTIPLYQSQINTAVDATVLNATPSAAYYGLAYLGTMKFPFGDDAISAMEGWGLDVVKDSQISLEIRLNVTRTTGVATMYIVDLIMLPLDEAFLEIHTPTDDPGRASLSAGDYWHMIYDNTGYYSHGKSGPRAYTGFEQSGTPKGVPVNMELRGSELFLIPRMDNRLFFWAKRYDGTATVELSPVNSLNEEVRINIVPRWRGVRDV